MKCYKSEILWITLTGLLLISFQSVAVVISEAQIRSDDGIFPTVTDGGFDVLTVEVSESGIVDPRSASAWALASAEQGRLAFSLSSTVNANSSPATISSGLGTTLAMTDTWDITPGGTGLPIGETAQVQMQIPLDGIVQLNGVPAGNSIVEFWVRANEVGSSGQEYLYYTTGIMDPLQNFQVHQFLTFDVDVTVGGQLRVDSDLIATMNGTSFEPAGASGTNFISFDPIIRITQAPGYETLSITSEAGALTSPIPIPAALWLFGSGLIGLIGVARRKTRI